MMILGIFAFALALLILDARVEGSYIINQTICLIVHVPLPKVQRVKQIPVKARTRVSPVSQVRRMDVLVRPMKFTNLAIIPLS
jgi:hypothetical protein